MKLSIKKRFTFLLNYMPLFVFIMYARLTGLIESSSGDWRYAFYLGASLAILSIAFQAWKGFLIDRLWLAGHLFLVVFATLFALNAHQILELVGQYKGVSFILTLIVVGVATTLFSPAGFIGASKGDPKEIKYNSLFLLCMCFVALVWSYATHTQSFWISVVVPILFLRIWNKKLLEDVE